MSRASRYIERAWGNDGGPVAATARLGSVAATDLRDLRDQYGDDAATVAAEIVAECKRLRRPVGRPKLANGRTAQVTAKLSPAERVLCKAAAKRSGRTLSDWARAALLAQTGKVAP